MASIQLRNVPDNLYEEITRRANEENRSIPQQTLNILKNAIDDLTEHKKRRREALKRASKTNWPPMAFNVAEEIRKDRDSR